MTEREIQEAILDVCNVDKSDSDFNIPRFYFLCDKLKELGAQEAREACEHICVENGALGLAAAIRARGEK